jgi:hypothetical protein
LTWPERELAVALRCEECGCLSEEARDSKAHLLEDDEEPDAETYVVAYCPLCALLEFHRAPRSRYT